CLPSSPDMACHHAMSVAARAGTADASAARAATSCRRRDADVTMALPVSHDERRLPLLKAGPRRFQPAMRGGRAAQSTCGPGTGWPSLNHLLDCIEPFGS